MQEAGTEKQPAEAQKKGTVLLDLGFIVLGAAWLAIIVKQGSPKVERWVASIALILVGVTGLVGTISRALRKDK